MRRVLLDEMLPWKVRRHLAHESVTTADAGWSGIRNGELLRLAAQEFDVMLTVDRGIPYQQHLAGVDLGLVIMKVPGLALPKLLPVLPEADIAIGLVRPGCVWCVPRDKKA